MQLFELSEATSARRQFYLHLVDATDGITPETGEAAGQPQYSKNGAAWGNTSATLTAVGNGLYYVVLTTGELDTLGTIAVRYKSANTCEFQGIAPVVAYDPYSATDMGLTTLANRASQASVDTIDDFLDTEIAALTTNLATANTNINTIDDFLDTEIAALTSNLATANTNINTIDDFFISHILMKCGHGQIRCIGA